LDYSVLFLRDAAGTSLTARTNRPPDSIHPQHLPDEGNGRPIFEIAT
jgi:hypothetical protein